MNLILASGKESTTNQASVPKSESFTEVSSSPNGIIKSDEFNFNYNNTGLRSIAG